MAGARSIPLAAWVALGAFVGLLMFWATMTPAYRAPDEPQHVSAVLGLAQGAGWPPPAAAEIDPGVLRSAVQAGFLTTPDQPTSRGNTLPGVHVASGRTTPPLYSAVDPTPGGQRLPYEDLGGPSGFTNQMTQHPPGYYAAQAAVYVALGADDWRWDRQLMLMRLVSAAMVGGLPLLAFLTVRRLSGSAAVGSAAAYLPLAVPQLAHVGSSVGNDALVVLLGAGLVTALSYLLTGSRPRLILLAVAVSLGLGLLTKGLVLPLVPATAVALVLGLRRTGLSWSATALRSLLTLTGAFAIGGWWWLLNLLRYGTLQPNGQGVDRPRAGPSVGVLDFAGRFVEQVNTSFWGTFGWLELPLPGLVTTGLAVIAAVLVIAAFADRAARVPLLALGLLPLVSVVALFVSLYAVHLRDGRFNGTQGRYLFGSLLVLLAAAAIGASVLGRLARVPDRWLVPLVALGSAAVAVYGGWAAFRGFYVDTGIDLSSAWATMAAWSPWPEWLVTAQLALGLSLLVAGPVSAMLTASARRGLVEHGGTA